MATETATTARSRLGTLLSRTGDMAVRLPMAAAFLLATCVAALLCLPFRLWDRLRRHFGMRPGAEA